MDCTERRWWTSRTDRAAQQINAALTRRENAKIVWPTKQIDKTSSANGETWTLRLKADYDLTLHCKGRRGLAETDQRHFAASRAPLKLGPHDVWFVFIMRHASWFAHRMYEKMCLIWVDVSFVHSSHLVHQLGGKLTHQSELYVSDSTNLFDTFTHGAPRIRTTHRVDPA